MNTCTTYCTQHSQYPYIKYNFGVLQYYLPTYLLTFLLTPCSRVRFEKLIGYQPVKKFPTFYGTRSFITAFTSVRHLSLSWASSIQSTPSHSTSWRSILILSSHLHLGLPSGLFCSGFRTKTLYTPLLSPHTCYMPRQSHSSRVYHPNNIGWGVEIHQLVIMQLHPLTCYLIPPGPNYSPQHPILKQPQPAFLPECQWPSFTPIQNNRQNYSSVYLSLYIVLK